MAEDLEGLKEVLKNLDIAGDEIVKGLITGMTAATIATESHIKQEFNRPATGKGFANRTGKLRASIRQDVEVKKNAIIGHIIAGSGAIDYAPYVEFRWSGKYAYMWPGIQEMKKRIFELLIKGAKGAI